MGEGSDMLVFWTVVAARLFVPLLIPRFPLPAILTALVLDGVDQSIFQTFTSLNLDGYQSYDKALDVYYLSIAYISTMRNWLNSFAFQVARFLFYYRLVGVLLFELFEARWLLLVFPNTFEYFFIVIEAVRLWWDPRRLSRKAVIGAAAAIWVFIKLPQEWWIHVAQLDVTDSLKTVVFGVDADDSWSTALSNRPAVTIGIVLLVAAVAAALWWLVVPRLPATDAAERRGLQADPLPAGIATSRDRARWRAATGRLWSTELAEQIVLISLVCSIFAQMLPGVEVTPLRMTAGVAVLVVLNSAIGLWTARRGQSVESLTAAFAVLFGVDVAFLFVSAQILNITFNRSALLVFLFLLVLIVALYTRNRPVLTFRRAGSPAPTATGTNLAP
jgi:hypothetical protein